MDAPTVPQPLEDPRAEDSRTARPRADAGDGGASDAAPPPPEPLDPSTPLVADVIRTQRYPGIALVVRVRFRGVPGPPDAPEVQTEAIEKLRQRMHGALQVRLASPGRMRVDVKSGGMLLPEGSALLGRARRYGHVLLWPDEHRYRVVPAGAARALFGEGRADVGQVARAAATPAGTSRRLGFDTRRVKLLSPLGTVTLELAELDEAGLAAGLFCRLVLDIGGIAPGHEICSGEEVVLAADYQWHRGGSGVRFEAVSVDARDDLRAADLAMPPPGVPFRPSGLPERSSLLLERDPLASLRSGPADLGPPPTHAPPRGLEALNRSDLTMLLLVDGIPASVVRPWKAVTVPSLHPGRYVVQWRSYLGTHVGAPSTERVPGRTVHGKPLPEDAPDAGR